MMDSGEGGFLRLPRQKMDISKSGIINTPMRVACCFSTSTISSQISADLAYSFDVSTHMSMEI